MKKLMDMSPVEVNRVIRKLKEALSSDAGERPAMAYAGIDEDDYKMITERHPELKKIAERASGILGAEASMVIRESITEDRDVKTARWYKEHTDPRFSAKVKVEGDVSLSAEERGEAVDRLFDELKNG